MAELAAIYRHPVKSLGVEALDRVLLAAGRTMPGDRVWAITHEASKFDASDPAWARCSNFARVAKVPALAAVTARLAGDRVTFSHPALPDLDADPDSPDGAAAILAWMAPLMPADRAAATGIARAPGRGMTDTPFPSVSIASCSSLADLSERAGTALSPLRFRMNFWLEGLSPWAEFDWIGREARLGASRLRIVERTGRCRATTANPETGESDLDTLALLRAGWGHTDFGVYAEVIEGGAVARGDRLELL